MTTEKVTELKIAYGGKAYEDNEIDAKTLGEALTSLGSLIEHAEKIINGESSEVQVTVRATREGSFELLVAVMGGLKTLEALGFVAGAGAATGSLLGIIEWLKGRKINEITIDKSKGTSTIEVDGESVTCSTEIQKLVTSPTIRKEIDKLVYRPLLTDQESTFKVQDGRRNVLKVSQADVETFKAPRSTTEQKSHVETFTKNVNFSRVNFNSANGWKMILPEIGEVTTSMNDKAFLERVSANEAIFSKDDLFVVEYSETVKETNGVLSGPKYSIEKVVRHRAAAGRKQV
ncbi:hypothetical protein N3553_12290 [Pantoea dispersa]|uniref:hypothetical protein n=1 Tax=Pantoea dispersa TaxID=59814 RepID=UPI0021AFAF8A|nr:hypothetical protein [Pantoea dispersa]MCT6590662.1 hypothetical protein [Pantoea dispersa]